MTKKKLDAKIIKKTPEYEGFLKVNKYEIEKDLHEGGKENITWYVMERGHAVGILAYDPVEDSVVLVNEMRSGILVDGGEPYTDTLPAGMIDKGETPLVAAIRETKEETGLDLKEARVIHGKSYVSAGGTSESIAIVFGIVDSTKAGGIHGKAEEHENIKVTVMKREEFMKKVRSGEINDLKSMVAAYWLTENAPSLQRNYKQTMKGEFDAKARKDIRTSYTSSYLSPSVTGPFMEMDRLAAQAATGAPHVLHIAYLPKTVTDPDMILADKALTLLYKNSINFSPLDQWFTAREQDPKPVLLNMVSLLAARLPQMRHNAQYYDEEKGRAERATWELFAVLQGKVTVEDIEDLVASRKSVMDGLSTDDNVTAGLVKQETRALLSLADDYRTYLSGRNDYGSYMSNIAARQNKRPSMNGP